MNKIMAAMALGASMVSVGAFGADGDDWDKTFRRSDKVITQKVSFKNRVNITIVAEMYLPKDFDETKPHAAIVVGHPFGGVKEQTAGIYAQKMAEEGFVTLAFDASFGGESGGEPRNISSPEIYSEDFSAAVDYLGTRPFVDRNRIGVIGICGSGGFAVNAAKVDPRMKAIATVSMYDMGRARRQGLDENLDKAHVTKALKAIGDQRWAEFESGNITYEPGVPVELTKDSYDVEREFHNYYRTPRGQHPRATTNMSLTSSGPLMNFYPFDHIETISPRPLLFIAGDQAHSRSFSEEAYAHSAEPKELFIVLGAGHVDLYDKVDLIPFKKITSFFRENLK
ncbi:alpha/beta hydrolase [Serratia sp. 3ACOL1]|uniref:alpha/beta hydrolase n=1 Tax=Serratia sp. 3ACOL1 TaxID=2448483 RepID=UPI000EF44EAB|nr:alpha/beta hydrolase [Serratia sp. 3ACOL1]AYM91019.1 alpha/beta hydrolase [Serratia sp. 3ACOL1]